MVFGVTAVSMARVVLDHIVLSGRDHGGVVDLKHHAASGGGRRLRERDGPGPEAFQQAAVMAVVGGDELGHHEDVVQIGEQPEDEVGAVLHPQIGVTGVRSLVDAGVGGRVPILECGDVNPPGGGADTEL